jgi:multidrug efflux system membrane fusion protein
VFPNKDDRLFPNQTVSARLQLSTLSGVLAVPQAAVLRGAKGFYVYVVNADHTVATRVVQPGAVDEGQMAVQGELQAGEQVVIDGSDRLREGAKVEVIAADPAQRSVPGARAVGVGRSKKPDGPGTFEQNSHVAPVNAASEAIKNISNPGAIAAQPAVEPASPTSPAPASGDAATTERPRWLDRLPPEVAEKVMKMSPDERREWIRKRREERANSSGSGG